MACRHVFALPHLDILHVAADGSCDPDAFRCAVAGNGVVGGLGVVQSSAAENGVTVTSNGSMEVNNINVTKLVQTAGDALILNGGSSTAPVIS